ncbi:MAG: IS1595 family transposase [Bacteroidota bacterium]
MSKTHVSPEHWFQITYLMCASGHSPSASELTRRYPYSDKTISKLMHAIRYQMGKCMDWKFENAIIEVDGAGVYTGKKGYDKHFRFKAGRGSQRKATIIVIRERGQRVKLFKAHSEDLESVLELLKEHVDKETCIIATDELATYNKLRALGYAHVVVNHSGEKDKTKRWKNGIASTNRAEGIFSLLKRTMRGGYINISDPYLQNYLNEIAFKVSYAQEYDYGFEILIRSFGSLYDYYRDKFPNETGREDAA